MSDFQNVESIWSFLEKNFHRPRDCDFCRQALKHINYEFPWAFSFEFGFKQWGHRISIIIFFWPIRSSKISSTTNAKVKTGLCFFHRPRFMIGGTFLYLNISDCLTNTQRTCLHILLKIKFLLCLSEKYKKKLIK